MPKYRQKGRGKMKQKLIIEVGNMGDASVGIAGLNAKITIEANVDMEDVLKDIRYMDNEKQFEKDVNTLITWIDEMGCSINKIYIE